MTTNTWNIVNQLRQTKKKEWPLTAWPLGKTRAHFTLSINKDAKLDNL